MTHQPIQPELYDKMEKLAAALDDILNPYGFALLVFPLENNDGRMNYISNAQRQDMLVAMKEFIANSEGRVITTEMPREIWANTSYDDNRYWNYKCDNTEEYVRKDLTPDSELLEALILLSKHTAIWNNPCTPRDAEVHAKVSAAIAKHTGKTG